MKKNIELPCLIGDELWCINDYNEIEKVECLGYLIDNQYTVSIYYQEKYAEEIYNMPLVAESPLLFLTEDEAIEGLKKRKLELRLQ